MQPGLSTHLPTPPRPQTLAGAPSHKNSGSPPAEIPRCSHLEGPVSECTLEFYFVENQGWDRGLGTNRSEPSFSLLLSTPMGVAGTLTGLEPAPVVPVLLTSSQKTWRPVSQEGCAVTWYHGSCGKKRRIEGGGV